MLMTCKPCYLILLSGLAAALISSVGNADQDVNITATVINNTCQLEVSNNGVVNLPTVRLDYFADSVTAETDYPGGNTFTIKLVECPLSNDQIAQINVNFTPQTGVLPAGNPQVFMNDLAANSNGAKNVGLAIFSDQANQARTNVLNRDGTTRAVYPVTAENYQNSLWPFYARMQKVAAAAAVSSGLLSSKVLVNITYQ